MIFQTRTGVFLVRLGANVVANRVFLDGNETTRVVNGTELNGFMKFPTRFTAIVIMNGASRTIFSAMYVGGGVGVFKAVVFAARNFLGRANHFALVIQVFDVKTSAVLYQSLKRPFASGVESLRCEDSNSVSKTTSKIGFGEFRKSASTREQSRVLACLSERHRLDVVA